MRRPEGTRREGFRRPQADRRGTAKPCGGILSPVPWGCRGNQWGPREARIPHEPRNASKNAGVDAVSEGTSPILNINKLNAVVANKDTFFVFPVPKKKV